MAWLPMYLLDRDVDLLNEWLNQEEAIAFLLPGGHNKWIAKKEHYIAAGIGTQKFSGEDDFVMPNAAAYTLWHVPSGPLPLLQTNPDGVSEQGKVENPWLGWTEIATWANARMPYCGVGHPGVMHLEIKLPHDQEIRMSSFGWIGNRYKIIGNGAHASTEKFWSKLKRMAKKVGTQIPRSNNPNEQKEVFAFPAAYEAIKNGRPCSLNP